MHRDAFLVHSDLALRTLLTEFRDHKMIREQRDSEGGTTLYIPMDGRMLRQVLEEMAED